MSKGKNLEIKGKSQSMPTDHFQINLDLTTEGNNSPRDCFNPRSPKNRPTMHVKTNECDH